MFSDIKTLFHIFSLAFGDLHTWPIFRSPNFEEDNLFDVVAYTMKWNNMLIVRTKYYSPRDKLVIISAMIFPESLFLWLWLLNATLSIGVDDQILR